MDDLFAALASPHRRLLLDRLNERDGRTLGELEAELPVTRFAVMKHLRVLEAAHLVVARKVGREKLHYLNRAPLQEMSDRWISRYAAPFARTMSDLKAALERPTPMSEAKSETLAETAPRHVYELFIRASAEAVWSILTDDAQTPLWQHFNMTSRTTWAVGGAIEFSAGDRPMIVGEIMELTPPRRLVHTFAARWSPEVADDKPSRVTWEIEPVGDGVCKLTLTHDDFGGATATSRAVRGGWPESLSRLKTLAETGTPLLMPAPAQG
ncbi:ArsR/SmtB family transcription factor [Segnochrobactrum spirostomi]|uniref:Helix-turn-helix domain-containing protein n=1 Tax=Segnochrobactrum spirostomi TaxID=2608987 RepID=A0A6A7Y258_9HYPH|nr:SRPBCC domain-containing protein [Segnochrobactrum spirostomi]MQT12201.1 helix-turn-helix domain-containing protein [Segnochrobactrum spirostomi]